jgi:Domain of unknown function (DUF4279)
MGKDLDPEEISQLLGMSPDVAHKRGDPNWGKQGRRYSDFSEGLWSLKSALSRDQLPAEHIKDITDKLAGREEVLEILRQRGYRIDIFIGIFGADGNSGFDLPANISGVVGRLGINLEFDLYS